MTEKSTIEEAEVREAYWQADRDNRVAESKIGCIVTLFLMPAGITADYFVYPEHLQEFALWRLGYDIFLLAILALHYTPLGRRFIPALSFLWLIAAQVTIALMIYVTEGYQSTYYAGLGLAMLAAGILLPTSVREVSAFCGATLLIYLVAALAGSHAPVDFALLYNNLYFLTLTGIVSIVAVFLASRRRYAAFRLRYELDQRNRELAELDRLKSEFFANVSHELRTPLTLILAPVENMLARTDALPHGVAEQLEMVRQNGVRLLQLVNDLLDVIRFDQSGVELEQRPIRLDALVAGSVAAMTHLAESRDIDLAVPQEQEALWVRGDRGALEKIVFNLLSNALKFTPAGAAVAVICEREDDYAVVRVRDQGIGIPEADLPHVFERFRQVDSSATRKYAGTGIGLALVKDMTERHQGEVEIHSQLGEGTEVTVRLPAIPAQAEENAEPQSAAWSPAAVHVAAASTSEIEQAEHSDDDTRPSVLIVDDEEDMRRYLAELLSAEYRVLQARDGAEGLALARSHHPDLVVLDLMMPEIDGLEVCRRLKSDAQTRGMRIVLLTARADESAKMNALEHGVDDFLTKPFSGIEIKKRLANLFRGAALERDLAQRNNELSLAFKELSETQNQLLQSEKVNALGRLSAGLLHEINNPLTYTLTALQVARQDPVIAGNSELREMLDDIDEGMHRIRVITSELRIFAYPAQHQLLPFPVEEAVASACKLTMHECREINVLSEIEPVHVALGSHTHIIQLLVNLITNAARAVRARNARRAEGDEITIRSQRLEDRVWISVRDNGIGIAPDKLERVFDPFYTTLDVGEGMGMGLSVCQTIARNHGGELRVRSELNGWTEFCFDLPAATESTQKKLWPEDA